jgi:RNA polymerase sigma factor (sigma-70 family)
MNSPQALDLNAPSDAELIAAVRGGDQAAYGQLFERHRDAAMRLARQLAGSSDADDLVSEAFIKVLNVISAGGGPDLAFRAYLLTAVRRLHVDKIRRTSKVTPTDELESFDPGVPFADPAVAEFENAAASKAFASLPERWQLVLWHIEVEGQKPAEVAPLLGMSANSVSALAYRAREGLRQAYLQMHMADTAAEECRWVTERLGARVRNGLSRRDTVKVDEHLDDCPRCAAIYLELSEVNSNLAGVLAPILLGAAASGYLASAGSGSLAAAPWLFRARHFIQGHGAVAAGTTAASAVAVTVAVAVITSGSPTRSTADDTGRADDNLAITRTSSTPSSSDRHSGDPTNGGPTSGPHTKSDPTKKSDPRDKGPGVLQPGDPKAGDPDANPGTSLATTRADEPGVTDPGSDASTDPGSTNSPPSQTHHTHTQPTHTTQPPTTTTTTTTTPPPADPEWDLSLSMSTVKLAGKRYKGTMTIGAPAAAKDVTVSISVNQANNIAFIGAGWSCNPPPSRGVTSYTCTASSNASDKLIVIVKFHPHASSPRLSGSVSAPGNDDPAPGNNTASLSL